MTDLIRSANSPARLRTALAVCLTIAAGFTLTCKPSVSADEHRSEHWRRCYIDDWVWYLAGADAPNCGTMGDPKTPEGIAAQVRCAEAHMARREPFYLYNWQQGIDSYLAVGWVQTPNGIRYQLDYDSSIGGTGVGGAAIWIRRCGDLFPAERVKNGGVLECRDPSPGICGCGPHYITEKCPADEPRSVPR